MGGLTLTPAEIRRRICIHGTEQFPPFDSQHGLLFIFNIQLIMSNCSMHEFGNDEFLLKFIKPLANTSVRTWNDCMETAALRLFFS